MAIADVGTGSGCIAVALAVHLPQACIIATDVSREALKVARENARRHGVVGRMDFRFGDLLEPLTEPVGLIVANLPYVTDEELPNLQPEVRDYEPRQALAGGPRGLTLLRALLKQAPSRLAPGGALLLEMDPRQRGTLEGAARRAFPQAGLRIVPDLAGRSRVLAVETTSA